MKKNRTQRCVFYATFILLLLLCWILIAAALLYTRANTLFSAQPEQQSTNYAQTSTHKAPLFHTLAPITEAAPQPPAIAARSAILIDARSGAVLYEKHADQSIPPASLTKLVAIYTAMQAVSDGKITLHDTIIPPPESWAVNIPAGSSLMFLGNDQQLTVEELLLGMSVVSGNDAAIALALHTSGSVAAFVKNMNEEMKKIGLIHTSFTEPSGLSEYNRTTARDFARFSYAYIQKYPRHLPDLHAIQDFTYPKPHNMLKNQPSIHQKATNTLLGKLSGCDGLKTGFIYESGFNIALTAERNGTRFIAVILGGAGKTGIQGKKIREQNGIALMEWAFSAFETKPLEIQPKTLTLPVLGSAEKPAFSAVQPEIQSYYRPQHAFYTALRATNTTQNIKTNILLPEYISAPVSTGERIGHIRIAQKINQKNYLLRDFPLTADTTIKRGNTLRWKYDHAAMQFFSMLNRITSH